MVTSQTLPCLMACDVNYDHNSNLSIEFVIIYTAWFNNASVFLNGFIQLILMRNKTTVFYKFFNNAKLLKLQNLKIEERVHRTSMPLLPVKVNGG